MNRFKGPARRKDEYRERSISFDEWCNLIGRSQRKLPQASKPKAKETEVKK